jgi:hypothetical protein
MASKLKQMARIISQRIRACVPTFVLVVACAAVAGPAFARTVYDGDWSVLIVSHGGACAPTFRYGVRIADGMVINNGGSIVTMQGRVTQKGLARVIVRSGGQWADGSGRLTKNHGGGVWKGQGTSGTCVGTWMAERRG